MLRCNAQGAQHPASTNAFQHLEYIGTQKTTPLRGLLIGADTRV